VEEDANSIDGLLSELRDSTVVPLLLNPFQITKLTCGSLITFYDSHRPDATVAVDVCLTALVLAKLMVVLPILMGEVDLQRMSGGAIGLLDRLSEVVAAAKLQLAARQGEQADGGLAAKAGQGLGEKENSVGDAGFQYQDADAYFGFGFDGWQSGIHEFPAFKDESSNAISENGFIKRGFPMGKLETLLSTTLHQLEGAVTIERERK